jgi:hypothetical protein
MRVSERVTSMVGLLNTEMEKLEVVVLSPDFSRRTENNEKPEADSPCAGHSDSAV